jgi:hypothetical protein
MFFLPLVKPPQLLPHLIFKCPMVDLTQLVLVVKYINKQWVPCHVIVGIFEVHEIARAAMALQLKDLFTRFDLYAKVIAYMKDEGTNLNTFTNILISIVSCVALMLPQPYANSYFGHVVSKCFEYAINDLKICVAMKEVSIKDAHVSL